VTDDLVELYLEEVDLEALEGDDVGGAEVYGSSPTDLGREAVDELYRSTRIAGAPFMKPLDPDGRGGDEE